MEENSNKDSSHLDQASPHLNPDSSHLKLNEFPLQESKDLFKSVFDTSLIQMSVMRAVRDENGNITDFRVILTNHELDRETGRTDLAGKYYTKEYPGIRTSGLFDVMLKVMETGNPGKIEYYYPHEGFNKWFSSMFVKLDDGLLSTNLDITERKLAEQKGFKNLTLLEQTEELAKSGSWEYDISTGNFWWSDGMYEIFQLPKGIAVTPYTYMDHVVPEDRHIAEKLIRTITETFEGFEEIMKLLIKDEVKTIKIKSVPVFNAEGFIDKVLGICIDLTASFQAEEILSIQNNKLFESKELLRKKDEFLNIAGHELKTPVTSLKAYAEILQQKFEETGEIEHAKLLQKMTTQVNRLTNLINNLLDTTRLTEGEISLTKDQFDINILIDEKVEELQRLSGKHKLSFEAQQLEPVFADRVRIGQVLTNIITNAIKYSPGGGEISINANPAVDGVEVSIQDQGMGMSQELLDKIFERFFRAEIPGNSASQGLGLGLYISEAIIRIHGGRISVASVVGTGTKFTFFLPASHPL